DGSERTLPSRDDDPYDINFSAPGQLAVAEVRLAIGSVDNGAQVRDLPYVAGMAAVFGLSPEDELRSVTLWPPRIFGRGDRFGSLEVGGGAPTSWWSTATSSRRGPEDRIRASRVNGSIRFQWT
ncbi:MAG: hypothetical protein WCC60_24150, partial [Ilumatobacteraceae bacterium]